MALITDAAFDSLKWIKKTFNGMRSSKAINTIENNIKNEQTGGSLIHSFVGESSYLTAEAAKKKRRKR